MALGQLDLPIHYVFNLLSISRHWTTYHDKHKMKECLSNCTIVHQSIQTTLLCQCQRFDDIGCIETKELCVYEPPKTTLMLEKLHMHLQLYTTSDVEKEEKKCWIHSKNKTWKHQLLHLFNVSSVRKELPVLTAHTTKAFHGLKCAFGRLRGIRDGNLCRFLKFLVDILDF